MVYCQRRSFNDIKGRIFVCAFFLSFLVFFFGSVGQASQTEKIKILLSSPLDAKQRVAFFERLSELNPKIDSKFIAGKASEIDVFIYLLDSWEVLDEAPFSDELPLLFDEVRAIKKPAISVTSFVSFNDSVERKFIFYSIIDAGSPPLECFARDIALRAGHEKGYEVSHDTLVDCRKELELNNE